MHHRRRLYAKAKRIEPSIRWRSVTTHELERIVGREFIYKDKAKKITQCARDTNKKKQGGCETTWDEFTRYLTSCFDTEETAQWFLVGVGATGMVLKHTREPKKVLKIQFDDDRGSIGFANLFREYSIMEQHRHIQDSPSRVAQVYERHRFDFLSNEQTVMPAMLTMWMEDAGLPLNTWLDTNPSMRQRGQVCSELILALHEIHYYGYAHCDLGLGNICVKSDTPSVKVIDFGLALELANSEQGILQVGESAWVSGRPRGGSYPFVGYENLAGKSRLNYTDDLESASLLIWRMFDAKDFEQRIPSTYKTHQALERLRQAVKHANRTAPQAIRGLFSVGRNAELSLPTAWADSEYVGQNPSAALNQVYNDMLTMIAQAFQLDGPAMTVPQTYHARAIPPFKNEKEFCTANIPARTTLSLDLFPPETFTTQDMKDITDIKGLRTWRSFLRHARDEDTVSDMVKRNKILRLLQVRADTQHLHMYNQNHGYFLM